MLLSFLLSSLFPPSATLHSSWPDEYNRTGTLLDLVEQALSFAVNQGLPGHQTCFFLSFYVSCLDLIAGPGNAEGLQYYIELLP